MSYSGTSTDGLFSRFLADNTLTKKASLSTLAAGVDYGARLFVGFVITPLLVAGLGSFFFGTWQVLQRTAGIASASGGATQALKYTLAHEQTCSDFEVKRRHVGSALAVCGIFLPIIAAVGAILSWYMPDWIDAPAKLAMHVRLASAILVIQLITSNIAMIPQLALEGENLGYKCMCLSSAFVLVGGGLTCLALYFKIGILGVAGASLGTVLLTGLGFLYVARRWAPWFGWAMPSLKEVRSFLGLGGWFMGWNVLTNIMLATDVIVLGMFDSVESVTKYSLSKYAPETLITLVAIMVFGITPGLGGIIGSRKLEKAVQVRGEIMLLTWLLATSLGTTVLIWNGPFIQFWVGKEHYVGPMATLLVTLLAFQFVLIRNDASIIDLTLCLRRKVLMGMCSAALSAFAAGVLVGYFKAGIMGLCLGLCFGRLILSLGYPALISRLLNISWTAQLKEVLRPALTTGIIFGLALFVLRNWPVGIIGSWIRLGFCVGATFGLVLIFGFYLGLSRKQRRQVWRRVQMALVTSIE